MAALTLTSAVFDTSGQKFGTAALNGGYGIDANGPSAFPLAFDCWVKGTTTPSGNRVAMGNSAKYGWMGINASGQATAIISGTGRVRQFTSSTLITDGGYHHLALSTDGTLEGTTFWLDGASQPQTSLTGSGAITFASGPMGVGADRDGTLPYPGEVDEAARWTTNRFTEPFTPPRVRYLGSETGLASLYRLDSDGSDSGGQTATAASTYVLSGPKSGTASAVSSNFSITASGTLASAVVLTLSDGGNGGTFRDTSGNVITTVTLASGTNPSAKFTYTPASAGAKSISATNNGGLTDPSALTYTASGVVVAADNAAISYSPFNWLVANGKAKTINSGAYLRTAFTGTSCTLNFDISALTGSYLPQIWYRIDRLYWQLARVASQVPLTMPSETTLWSKHTIEVVIKSTSEFQTRWSPQNTAVVLTGLTLATGAAVSAIGALSTKNVLFYGDSITEGYHVLNGNASGSDDPAGSDVLSSWAFPQRDHLGAEVGVVGFGGTCLTLAGLGGVPALTSSYSQLWSGQARSFTPVPDLVVILIGANDANNNVTAANFQASYTTLLNGLLAACPTSVIAACRPFSLGSVYVPQIQAAIAACNDPSRVTYIDTTGFFDTTLSYDALHPYGIACIQSIAPSMAAALRPLLYPAGSKPGFRPGFSG